MEDSGAKTNVEYDSPDQEVSEGRNISSSLETILVIFLARNVATLFPCPNNLPEAELKKRFSDSRVLTVPCGF